MAFALASRLSSTFARSVSSMSASSFLAGATLVNAAGDTRAGESLGADGRVLALYFAADWCPDCRDFQPAMNAFYARANEAAPAIDVVFVSSDTSADDQQAHLADKQGAWWALPFDSPLRNELKRKYGVCAGKEQVAVGVTKRVGGIPSLVIVRPSGELLDLQGVDKVEKDGAGALTAFQKLYQ